MNKLPSNTQVLKVAQKILENTSNWLIQQGSTVEMIDFSPPVLPGTFSETLLISTWMDKFEYKWQYDNSTQILQSAVFPSFSCIKLTTTG